LDCRDADGKRLKQPVTLFVGGGLRVVSPVGLEGHLRHVAIIRLAKKYSGLICAGSLEYLDDDLTLGAARLYIGQGVFGLHKGEHLVDDGADHAPFNQ
jgi:hypothetical protein